MTPRSIDRHIYICRVAAACTNLLSFDSPRPTIFLHWQGLQSFLFSSFLPSFLRAGFSTGLGPFIEHCLFSHEIYDIFCYSRDIMSETQNALRQFQANPDWRQIAAFFLGWVFFSSVRHIWYACFLRETIKSAALAFCNVFRDHRGTTTDVEKNRTLHRANRLNMDMEHLPNRFFTIFLLLCAFATSSLSQFLSLLIFGRGDGTLCAITLALGLGASIAGRVIGLFMTSLELKHQYGARFYELIIYWFLLLSVLGVTASTIFFSLGSIIVVPNLSNAICVKQHFMPSSLTASLVLILLESYSIFRMLFAVELPHGLWDVRIFRVVALLIFDLAVLIPDAIPTNVLGDFLPFSIGAIIVLSAFTSQMTPRHPRVSLITDLRPSNLSALESFDSNSPRITPNEVDNQAGMTLPWSTAMNDALAGGGRGPSHTVQEMNNTVNPMWLDYTRPGLHMPKPISLIPNQLPESREDVPESRNGLAASRSSMAQSQADSSENAVVQTAVRQPMPPGLVAPVVSPAEAQRHRKILSSQSQVAEAMNQVYSNGLAPPPRSIVRPQLVVDTSGSRRDSRRVSFSTSPFDIASHRSLAQRGPEYMSTPGILDVAAHPVRSNTTFAGPASLAAHSPPSTLYSPESALETHQSYISVRFLQNDSVLTTYEGIGKVNRVSNAPTFGRPRNSRRPNVPVTPQSSLGELLVPPPWMAQPVRPLRIVRGLYGPRIRPPNSAPPA